MGRAMGRATRPITRAPSSVTTTLSLMPAVNAPCSRSAVGMGNHMPASKGRSTLSCRLATCHSPQSGAKETPTE